MEETIPALYTTARQVFSDLILPIGTDFIQWIIATEGVKEFFILGLVGSIIGLVYRIKRG